jgi:trigger factor
MNVEFNKIDNVNGVVTVMISEEDFADKIKQQLKQIGKTRPEPGFRAGHVPAGILEKKYGKAVRYDVIDKVVSEALFDFIKKEELRVLGNPMPDVNAMPNLDEKEIVFKFKVGLAPEINVNVDNNLTITYYNIKVSDEMIEKQDEALRRRFGSQVPGETVEPNALVKGVLTELNEDGSVKEGGIVVENGIVSPQYFSSEEQRNLFIGKNVGAAIDFNPAATCNNSAAELSSMLHISKDEVEAHQGNFRMDISEIIVLRPAELNQEYFDEVFGSDKVHNEEEYRQGVSDMIANQLKGDQNYRFSIDAREAVMNQVGTLTLPDEVLKDYLKSQSEELTDETVDAEYNKLRGDLEWQLTRDQIAKQLEIKLEEEDLINIAKMAARSQFAQYGMTSVPDDVLAKYATDILKDAKARENMANQALDMKLFNGIRAKANIEEKDVTVEEFNQLFQPKEA